VQSVCEGVGCMRPLYAPCLAPFASVFRGRDGNRYSAATCRDTAGCLPHLFVREAGMMRGKSALSRAPWDPPKPPCPASISLAAWVMFCCPKTGPGEMLHFGLSVTLHPETCSSHSPATRPPFVSKLRLGDITSPRNLEPVQQDSERESGC
jgi:hypothetical protein